MKKNIIQYYIDMFKDDMFVSDIIKIVKIRKEHKNIISGLKEFVFIVNEYYSCIEVRELEKYKNVKNEENEKNLLYMSNCMKELLGA